MHRGGYSESDALSGGIEAEEIIPDQLPEQEQESEEDMAIGDKLVNLDDLKVAYDKQQADTNSLESAFNNMRPSLFYEVDVSSDVIEGAYIATAGSPQAQSVINMTPVENSGYGYLIKDCLAGDKFVITGSGANLPRLWAFVNNQNVLLSVSAIDATATNLEVTAPVGSEKAIFNFGISAGYKVIQKNAYIHVKDYVDNTEAEIENNINNKIDKQIDTEYKNLALKSHFADYSTYSEIADVWNCAANTVSFSNGEMVFASAAYMGVVEQNISVISGHKYYVKTLGHSTTDQVVRLLFMGTEIPIKQTTQTYSFIVEAGSTGTQAVKIIDYASVTRQTAYIKNILVVDLTEMYGAGNEPTNEDFTSLLEFFEEGYFSPLATREELMTYINNSMNALKNKDASLEHEQIFDYYVPIIPIPDYSDTSSKPLKSITLSEMMTMWGDLVNYYPKLTKKVLGKDASNTYDIWEITYKPDSPKMKIILVANVHGYTSDSKSASLALYYFIWDINRNYTKSKALRWLHENVEFVFIPIGNPYGWVTGSRFNANGVNINRNYSYGFEVTEDSGPYAFSEVETQYIRDMLIENKDSVAVFDLHCYGDDSSTSTVEYCSVCFDEYSVGYKTSKDLAYYFCSVYQDAIPNILLNHGATLTAYAEGALALNAVCLEFSTKPANLTPQFCTEHIRRHIEWYGNVIYKWAHEYPMLYDFILGIDGKKYTQSVNENGALVLTQINEYE